AVDAGAPPQLVRARGGGIPPADRREPSRPAERAAELSPIGQDRIRAIAGRPPAPRGRPWAWRGTPPSTIAPGRRATGSPPRSSRPARTAARHVAPADRRGRGAPALPAPANGPPWRSTAARRGWAPSAISGHPRRRPAPADSRPRDRAWR